MLWKDWYHLQPDVIDRISSVYKEPTLEWFHKTCHISHWHQRNKGPENANFWKRVTTFRFLRLSPFTKKTWICENSDVLCKCSTYLHRIFSSRKLSSKVKHKEHIQCSQLSAPTDFSQSHLWPSSVNHFFYVTLKNGWVAIIGQW